MNKINLDEFIQIAGTLKYISNLAERPDVQGQSIQEHKTDLIESLDEIIEKLVALDLTVSQKGFERLRDEVSSRQNFTFAELGKMTDELLNRIQDETESIICVMIPAGKAAYYNEPELFGNEVTNNFPSTLIDIEEGANCYALGRNTSTVFHLMRVLEIGLRALATSITITLPNNPNWGVILREINNELNKTPPNPIVTGQRQFYAEAYAHLDSIRIAWRNPTIHVERTYDEDEALEVLQHVRSFMQHLATQIHE